MSQNSSASLTGWRRFFMRRTLDGKTRLRGPVVALGLTAVFFGTTAGSCGNNSSNNGSQQSGQALTEQAHAKQTANPATQYPATQLSDSLELRNLKRRLLETNDPKAHGYVYLVSFGKFLGYYVVYGKISSLQSQMTTDTLIEYACHDGVFSPPDKKKGESLDMTNDCTPLTVPAPSDDGSYGPNEGGDKGIFFYTSSGVRVDTDTDFLYSTKPLTVGDIPQLG
jgi:hypothetical protein